jgi:hypothetical protein
VPRSRSSQQLTPGVGHQRCRRRKPQECSIGRHKHGPRGLHHAVHAFGCPRDLLTCGSHVSALGACGAAEARRLTRPQATTEPCTPRERGVLGWRRGPTRSQEVPGASPTAHGLPQRGTQHTTHARGMSAAARAVRVGRPRCGNPQCPAGRSLVGRGLACATSAGGLVWTPGEGNRAVRVSEPPRCGPLGRAGGLSRWPGAQRPPLWEWARPLCALLGACVNGVALSSRSQGLVLSAPSPCRRSAMSPRGSQDGRGELTACAEADGGRRKTGTGLRAFLGASACPTRACRRRQTASAPPSLPLSAAPDA